VTCLRGLHHRLTVDHPSSFCSLWNLQVGFDQAFWEGELACIDGLAGMESGGVNTSTCIGHFQDIGFGTKASNKSRSRSM
jgi:hypothetical protein